VPAVVHVVAQVAAEMRRVVTLAAGPYEMKEQVSDLAVERLHSSPTWLQAAVSVFTFYCDRDATKLNRLLLQDIRNLLPPKAGLRCQWRAL
jgi:hypothetical protein